MQIKNRLFSYPVYASDVDDYNNPKFEFNYTVAIEQESLTINYKVSLSNTTLINKIQNEDIKLVLHVECPQTFYREIINLELFEGAISLKLKNLMGRVEVCCMLVANVDTTINQSFGINREYGATVFKVKRGFILGYDNSYSFTVPKEKDELFKPSSIITVVKKLNLADEFDIDLNDSNKIRIQLNEEMYTMFVQMQGNLQVPVVHSMIVLPTLTYVVEQIKNSDARKEFEDYMWYVSIEKQLKSIGLEIDSKEFESMNTVVIAQKLLKSPVKNALVSLTKRED